MLDKYLDEDLKEVLDPLNYDKKYKKIKEIHERERQGRDENEYNETTYRNKKISTESETDAFDNKSQTQSKFVEATRRKSKKLEDNTVTNFNTTETEALTTKAQTKYEKMNPSKNAFDKSKKKGLNLLGARPQKAEKKRKRIREQEGKE